MPNVFTPNSDGYNDIFKVYSESEIERGSLRIFNRWGNVMYEEVFEQFSTMAGWNGQVGERESLQEVYVYQLQWRTSNEQWRQETGDLTLLR